MLLWCAGHPWGSTLLCTAAFCSVPPEQPTHHTSLVTQKSACCALPLSPPTAHGKGPVLPPSGRGKGHRVVERPPLPGFWVLNAGTFAAWLSWVKGRTVSWFSPWSPSDSFKRMHLPALLHTTDLDGVGAGAWDTQEVRNHSCPISDGICDHLTGSSTLS